MDDFDVTFDGDYAAAATHRVHRHEYTVHLIPTAPFAADGGVRQNQEADRDCAEFAHAARDAVLKHAARDGVVTIWHSLSYRAAGSREPREAWFWDLGPQNEEISKATFDKLKALGFKVKQRP